MVEATQSSNPVPKGAGIFFAQAPESGPEAPRVEPTSTRRHLLGLNAMPAPTILALLGLVLCWAYEKTGALFLAMGIHAGVVICEKSFRFVTQPTPGTHELLWGDNLLVQGVAASIIIVVIFLGLRQQFAAKPVPAEIQK